MKILFSFFASLGLLCCNLPTGSYPDAERYTIKTSETELISRIKAFKENHPEFNIPESVELTSGNAGTIKDGKKDHWYRCFFYYPQENQIVFAWVREDGKEKSTFAFVAVNYGLKSENWRDINKGFDSDENAVQIQKFEDRILKFLK